MGEIASRGQLRAAYWCWALVTVPLMVLLGFASASLAPGGAGNRWYAALAKPAINPPDWVFPVAWTVLYVLLGLVLALLLNARGARWRGLAIALFAAQAVANFAWSPIFFGLHLLFWGLVTIGAMFALALATTLVAGRFRPLAAWLMVPYLAWLVFAGLLNLAILRLNPGAEGLATPPPVTQIDL